MLNPVNFKSTSVPFREVLNSSANNNNNNKN